MFGKRNKIGKLSTAMNLISLGLTVKSVVWDRIPAEQRAQLLVSAKEAGVRGKDQVAGYAIKIKSTVLGEKRDSTKQEEDDSLKGE